MLASELARELDVAESTVSRLLSNERRPGWDLVERIEDVLGWSVGDQADEVRCGTYGQVLRRKMEECRGGTESESSSVRSVPGVGLDGDGLQALATSEAGGSAGQVGEKGAGGSEAGAGTER